MNNVTKHPSLGEGVGGPKILLLGSGELGKEFAIAAKRKGIYVVACDRYAGAPAMQVADEYEVFSMLDGDALEAVVRKHQPDIIVPEIEAIRTERLFQFEEEGIQVVPSARAVNYTMNRRAIRDLAARELGLRTAKYFYAKTFEEFKKAADEIGFPCVVKPLMSSSGHGQSYVHNDGELAEAFREAMEGSRGDVKEVIIEEFIDFESEFTLLTVATLSDQRRSLEAGPTHGRRGDARADGLWHLGRRVLPDEAGRGDLLGTLAASARHGHGDAGPHH